MKRGQSKAQEGKMVCWELWHSGSACLRERKEVSNEQMMWKKKGNCSKMLLMSLSKLSIRTTNMSTILQSAIDDFWPEGYMLIALFEETAAEFCALSSLLLDEKPRGCVMSDTWLASESGKQFWRLSWVFVCDCVCVSSCQSGVVRTGTHFSPTVWGHFFEVRKITTILSFHFSLI